MIPEHVILQDVLPRLPSKSLLRFMCVCKSWNSCIRDPSFRNRQMLLFVCPSLSLYEYLPNTNPQVFTAPLLQHQPDIIPPATSSLVVTTPELRYSNIAIQCVNGFLCVHPLRHYIMSESSIQVFNPTTRQLIPLPDDTIRVRGVTHTKKHLTVGTHFGYDPLQDEFKVLRFIENNYAYQFRILTVGGSNKSWMDIAPSTPFDPTIGRYVGGQKGVCINGAIYWVYRSQKLVAFDLRNKHFGVIALPPGYAYNKGVPIRWTKYQELVEIGGCLNLIGYNKSYLNLWILKDFHTEVWIKESIELPCMKNSPRLFVWQQLPICPLGKMYTGEILFVPYFLVKQVKAHYYDMKRRSLRSIVIAEVPHWWWPEQSRRLVDMFFCQENFRILK